MGEMKFFHRLRAANIRRGIEWHGKILTPIERMEDLLFRSNELAGETGEACNAVKKLVRHRQNMPGGVPLQESKQHIADELADIIICADRVADSLEIDLEEATIRKFNLTSDKHGFETKLS